jgi:hypothetical protein
MFCKFFIIIIVGFLSSSSICFAGIGRQEDFGIGARSATQVIGCCPACNLNLIGFAYGQRAFDLYLRNRTCQIEGVIIGQYTRAWGLYAASVRQAATIIACQEQSLGGFWSGCYYPSARQDQSISISLGQKVRTHGAGSTFGTQCVVVSQHQTLVTHGGIGTQSQFVAVAQAGAARSGRCSNASVCQSVNMTASQHQFF